MINTQYFKYAIFFILISSLGCKEKTDQTVPPFTGEIETIENEDVASNDTKLLNEAYDYLLTGIVIGGTVKDNVMGLEPIEDVVSFIHDRNHTMKQETDTVAHKLNVIMIHKPSPARVKDIESINVTETREEMVEVYKDWLLNYSNQMQIISRKMIDNASDQSLVLLGTKLNSYSHALDRAYESLDKAV